MYIPQHQHLFLGQSQAYTVHKNHKSCKVRMTKDDFILKRMTSDSPASLASGFSSMVAMMQSTISFLYSNPPWATHRQGCHLIKQQDNSPHSPSCPQTLPGQYTGCHLIKQQDTSPHSHSCPQTLPGQYTDTVSFNKTTRHQSAISFLYSNPPWARERHIVV